jgi:polar amino acid transport system permease protein
MPNFDFAVFFSRILQPSPVFLEALLTTVTIAVLSQLLGTILGVLSALAARSRFLVLRFVSSFYVWLLRGTPALVQVFFLFYGLPLILGVQLFPREFSLGFITISGAMIAGIIALGLNEGAYMSEIVRAGIESVDKGQMESALSVGMTPSLAMRRIILPQAARLILPPLGNEFNQMLKSTSLLAFIGVYEIFLDTQTGYARTFKPAEYFLSIAVWYLLLTSLWGFVQAALERKLSAGYAPMNSVSVRGQKPLARSGTTPTEETPLEQKSLEHTSLEVRR